MRVDVFIKFKVSEHPFKQNENMLMYMKVLLHTFFYNNSLNILKENLLNKCYLLFHDTVQILGK